MKVRHWLIVALGALAFGTIASATQAAPGGTAATMQLQTAAEGSPVVQVHSRRYRHCHRNWRGRRHCHRR